MIRLPERPLVSALRQRRLDDVLRAIHSDPSTNFVALIRDELRVDLTTSYGGLPIPHPFGKASGQLSCNVSQVGEDADAGLAFVVLKTVIGERASGARSMAEWSNPETRMQIERCQSVGGRMGWTVTWKGRGWSGSLSEYCEFLDSALKRGADNDLLVVPSVKYHLPRANERHDAREYEFTTKSLGRVWNKHRSTPLVLEKDLSPTLAGDTRGKDRQTVLDWLSHLTKWIRAATDLRLGIKVMNAVYDDDFQLEMLRAVMSGEDKPDFLVVFNRLFDVSTGVAYGGWDLSDRNLRVLDRAGEEGIPLAPLSGTGNICSGKMMLEYALRGCENGQIHTFFQVPRREYLVTVGSRSRCALFTLCLHPEWGLVPWLWSLNELGHVEQRNGVIHFSDTVGLGVR